MIIDTNKITWTHYSSTITTGGTAQDAVAANKSRQFLWIQNPPTNTENISFDFDRTAVGDGTSPTLEPGGIVVFDIMTPRAAVSIIGATTGTKFIVKEA